MDLEVFFSDLKQRVEALLESLSPIQRETVSSNHYGFLHYLKIIQTEFRKKEAKNRKAIQEAWKRVTYFGKNLKVFEQYKGNDILRRQLLKFLNE